MIYLFTRNPDGSVVSSSHGDLPAARSALETFVSTARKFGYQVEPSTLSDELNCSYSARSGNQVISYWLSECAAFAGSRCFFSDSASPSISRSAASPSSR
jgi:hypothetical protein